MDSAFADGSTSPSTGAAIAAKLLMREPGFRSPVAEMISGLSSWWKLSWQNGQSSEYSTCHNSWWQGNLPLQRGQWT